MARFHCPDGKIPLLSTVPIVVQYLAAKVDLLLSNVIAPTTLLSRYNHWDLNLQFAIDEWSAHLSGFLYSESFENLNKQIAGQGANLREMVAATVQNPECMPTVSLDFQHIADHYGIREDRAKVRILLIS